MNVYFSIFEGGHTIRFEREEPNTSNSIIADLHIVPFFLQYSYQLSYTIRIQEVFHVLVNLQYSH